MSLKTIWGYMVPFLSGYRVYHMVPFVGKGHHMVLHMVTSRSQCSATARYNNSLNIKNWEISVCNMIGFWSWLIQYIDLVLECWSELYG